MYKSYTYSWMNFYVWLYLYNHYTDKDTEPSHPGKFSCAFQSISLPVCFHHREVLPDQIFVTWNYTASSVPVPLLFYLLLCILFNFSPGGRHVNYFQFWVLMNKAARTSHGHTHIHTHTEISFQYILKSRLVGSRSVRHVTVLDPAQAVF